MNDDWCKNYLKYVYKFGYQTNHIGSRHHLFVNVFPFWAPCFSQVPGFRHVHESTFVENCSKYLSACISVYIYIHKYLFIYLFIYLSIYIYIFIVIMYAYEIIWGCTDSHGVTVGPLHATGQAPSRAPARAPCWAGKDPFGEVGNPRDVGKDVEHP